MHKPVLIANSHKKNVTRRGGGGDFAAMQKDIRRLLSQDRGSDVFFTSMIDLYALRKEFPGTVEAGNLSAKPYCRVRALEQSWAKKTGDHRFIPHIQLHECEAYLFANISILSDYYPDDRRAIEKLAKLREKTEPELIDNGPGTAPSKRIAKCIPRYASDKATVGVQAAVRIGLAKIRQECRHFSEWLERLESLGTQREARPAVD